MEAKFDAKFKPLQELAKLATAKRLHFLHIINTDSFS